MGKSDVIERLIEKVCHIQFEKLDGTVRDMKATLLEILLPEQAAPKEGAVKKALNPDVFSVWDTEAEGWRSFRWDRLKTVDGENFVV